MKKTTFGIIVGNRGFFPDALAKQGRKDILDVLKKNGFNVKAYGFSRLRRALDITIAPSGTTS